MPRRALDSGDRDDFADICAHTREGFRETLDLVLLHNEQTVRGVEDPRVTLNKLIAFLSVATWERFIGDTRRLLDGQYTGAGAASNAKAGAYLSADRGGRAVDTLRTASADVIPAGWRIRMPSPRAVQPGNGKELTFGALFHGADPHVTTVADWWIELRNGIAHRNDLDRLPRWLVRTDASGRTVNTTTARYAFTLFLQLVDQSILGISSSAGFEHPDELSVPRAWLDGRTEPRHRITSMDQLQIWRGRSLASQ